jgi:RNA polymerase sigma factor (sigma-70 family)
MKRDTTTQQPAPKTLDDLIAGYSSFIDASIKKVTRGHVREDDLDDVRQQIFLRVFTSGYLDKFDASRASFTTYLYTLIHSVVCNWIEYNSRRALTHSVPLSFGDTEFGTEADRTEGALVFDTLQSDDRFEERLLAALTLDGIQSGLAPTDAKVFGLLREQATSREIGAELGISIDAASNRVRRVRQAAALAV